MQTLRIFFLFLSTSSSMGRNPARARLATTQKSASSYNSRMLSASDIYNRIVPDFKPENIGQFYTLPENRIGLHSHLITYLYPFFVFYLFVSPNQCYY